VLVVFVVEGFVAGVVVVELVFVVDEVFDALIIEDVVEVAVGKVVLVEVVEELFGSVLDEFSEKTVSVIVGVMSGIPTLQIKVSPTSVIIPRGSKSLGIKFPQNIFFSPPYQIAELEGIIVSKELLIDCGCPWARWGLCQVPKQEVGLKSMASALVNKSLVP
jgi:hypothetical protein